MAVMTAKTSRAGAWLRARVSEFSWREASGALGDVGIFVTILVALARELQLSIGSTLLFSGAYNVVTGILLNAPVPVQPMKSIAAVALSGSITLEQLLAAGICVAAIVLLLGVTNLISAFNSVVPRSLIAGIQMGVGLRLAMKGLQMAFMDGGSQGSDEYRPWIGKDGMDGLITALLAAILVAATASPTSKATREPGSILALRFPTALILVCIGIVHSLITDKDARQALRFGPSPLQFIVPSADDFRIGFLNAALPQLPLTTLNSVISICALHADLFSERPPISCRRMAISVGLMNLTGCWFGCMPCCHGAGGLSAQYRFGARTGTAVLFLGACKMTLALVLGSSLELLLASFPQTLLGIMMAAAGMELASACRRVTDEREVFEMIVVAASTLFTASTWFGFLAGVGLHLVLAIADADLHQAVVGCVSRGMRLLRVRKNKSHCSSDTGASENGISTSTHAKPKYIPLGVLSDAVNGGEDAEDVAIIQCDEMESVSDESGGDG